MEFFHACEFAYGMLVQLLFVCFFLVFNHMHFLAFHVGVSQIQALLLLLLDRLLFPLQPHHRSNPLRLIQMPVRSWLFNFFFHLPVLFLSFPSA
jgi:hypothetical protein